MARPTFESLEIASADGNFFCDMGASVIAKPQLEGKLGGVAEGKLSFMAT